MQKIHLAEEEAWDKKRIAVGVIITLLLAAGIAYGAKSFFLEKKQGIVAGARVERERVLAPIENQPSFSLPSQSDIQQEIDKIRQDALKLNVSEIASSSPQVQKVLNDIKTLGDYPRSQAKDICQQICSGL
ncbi:MAG: hypothetical protein HYY87_00850 [Candidatus Levybacteria bacterium]|nr:hypothetical protein [Candidatus Levybacteria bacterium]MBI3093057.1 hypothetical protein [Candidatus Levybacteria bacterium]